MSFPRYERYKDSGVEWLGEVPEHWKLEKLHHIAILNPTKAELGDIDPQTAISFLPMEAFDTKGDPSLSLERTIGQVETGYTYFRDGDVAFAKVTPCFENGKRAIFSKLTNGFGFGTTELIVLRARPRQTIPKFLYWFVATSEFLGFGEGSMYGAGGLKRVPESFVHQFPVCVPGTDEQNSIVAFLDRETAKIDALIEEQRRLIELLKEKRQAVISHAVTKGLKPDISMKNSGIEWIGNVPNSWQIKRLRMVATVRGGVAKGRDLGESETISVPYLRVANVQDGYLDLNEIATIEITATELERYRLRPGDVLMNEGGDFDKLGRGHIWRGEIEDCIHQNHVFSVRPKEIEPEWLTLISTADCGRFYFMIRSKQSTNLASISSSNLGELPVPLPPSSERKEILERVDDITSELNNLIRDAISATALLQERRSALISAAVTGKIDVRKYTPERPHEPA